MDIYMVGGPLNGHVYRVVPETQTVTVEGVEGVYLRSPMAGVTVFQFRGKGVTVSEPSRWEKRRAHVDWPLQPTT